MRVNNMVLLFIVYSNAVDEEMVEIVMRRAGGYTKFVGVQGEGQGEPQLGTHIWPGINNCMMVAMDKENEKKIVHDIDALKVKFPGMGVKIFSTKISRVK
jgi:hypothetical protein